MYMSKRKKSTPQQPKVRSVVAAQAHLRGGAGVHDDQKRRNCPRVLRRDKSYREAY